MISKQSSPLDKSNQPQSQLKDLPIQDNDELDLLKSRKPLRQNEEKPIKKKRKLLSFQNEEDQEQPSLVPKIKKNINMKSEKGKQVNKTDNLQEQLKEEYFRELERMKEELIELEYTYWDGPNVIKVVRRKKKENIREMLEKCRIQIIQNFQSVAGIEASDLLFIIKDFIVPHQMSLAEVELLGLKTAKNDLLLNLRHVKIKKDGKDMTLSVNLDGPARIIERLRYQKNKAVFPFCNWHTLALN